MFEIDVVTRIAIDAEPDAVWAVLADLDSYGRWNPTITSARGRLEPGGRLELEFRREGGKPRRFRPKLLVVEPGRRLSWSGRPEVPLVLESEHYFDMAPDDGGTRLVHGMRFRGLFVALASGWLREGTRGPFEAMNEALKRRLEEGSPS